MATERPETVTLLGEAPTFVAMLEHVSKAAPLSKPVLVIGERGTGKELITSRLHYLSGRWERPLVKVNCAALTESLLESELFGHEAGAFTGAAGRRVGRFEQADGGSLVLDELGTIPLRMQEKILRVIEYGEFERVGGSQTLITDARLIGVTNQDLPQLAARGTLRADLLDRLAFDVIHVPPLRARPQDIMTLAQHFAVQVTGELKRRLFAGFSTEATAALLGHRWPGNVRELKNTVERSVYRAADPDAAVARIVFDPFASPFEPLPGPADHGVAPAAPPPAPRRPDAPGTAELPLDFKATVARFEAALLHQALERARHNRRIASELLGLSYDQLRGLVRKYPPAANAR